MKIIVGLGNIGAQYVRTRHNCGFTVLDELVRQLEEEGLSIKWKEDTSLSAIITKISYKGQTIFLAKPTTLMNNSGQAIQRILNFFKKPTENLIVIFDDIDLPLGEIRFREKGGAGTHNGMKSVIRHLGTENFARLRIGIESRGELTQKKQEISNYVLTNFTEKEVPLLETSVKTAVKELKNLIST